jgi:hypothetical protein
MSSAPLLFLPEEQDAAAKLMPQAPRIPVPLWKCGFCYSMEMCSHRYGPEVIAWMYQMPERDHERDRREAERDKKNGMTVVTDSLTYLRTNK